MRHVAVFLFTIVSVFAQSGGTGTIQGTVTDPSGAVVTGASVTATNLKTGVKTERKTTDAGFFVLSLLPAGEYIGDGQGHRDSRPSPSARWSWMPWRSWAWISSCKSERPTNRSPWKTRRPC